jgi:ATP-dependent Zn protease
MMKEVKAYHEAGHAVIARVLGVEVDYVVLFSTDPSNESAALTHSATWRHSNADVPTLASAIEKDAKVSLAGIYAQSRRFPPKTKKAYSSDSKNGREGIRPTPDDTTYEPDASARAEYEILFNRLCKETEKLVGENWPAIERVAEALVSRPILLQDDLDRLIDNRSVLTLDAVLAK